MGYPNVIPVNDPDGPGIFVMSITEKQLVVVDLTPYLTNTSDTQFGNQVSTILSLDNPSDSPITPETPPTLDGNIVQQWLSGPNDLSQTGQYLLIITVTATPSNRIWAAEVQLDISK